VLATRPDRSIEAADLAGLVAKETHFTFGGITGYSGGGKKMIEDYAIKGKSASHFAPYGLNFHHKHLPEMKLYTGLAHDVLFQPAVGDFAQGMLTTVPLHLPDISGHEIHAAIVEYHAKVRFIAVASLDSTDDINPQAYNNSNNMRINVFSNDKRGHVVLMAIYDNLGKGASGAAVQNLNLMIGADEAASVNL
jgi:N-acetyl-gamma-glutamyl-phosphate reductase